MYHMYHFFSYYAGARKKNKKFFLLRVYVYM